MLTGVLGIARQAATVFPAAHHRLPVAYRHKATPGLFTSRLRQVCRDHNPPPPCCGSCWSPYLLSSLFAPSYYCLCVPHILIGCCSPGSRPHQAQRLPARSGNAASATARSPCLAAIAVGSGVYRGAAIIRSATRSPLSGCWAASGPRASACLAGSSSCTLMAGGCTTLLPCW